MTEQLGQRCRWPHKIPWASRKEALAFLKRSNSRGDRVYSCPAGHWHITSRSHVSKAHRKAGG